MCFTRTLLQLGTAASSFSFAACGGGDEALNPEDHTAASYTVLVDDVEQGAPFTFTAGDTVRVRIKYFNAAGSDLDDIESDHFGQLTFNPTTLATATPVTDHHYQFDVTGAAAGSGTMQVHYGHDEAADEVTVEPVAVTATE